MMGRDLSTRKCVTKHYAAQYCVGHNVRSRSGIHKLHIFGHKEEEEEEENFFPLASSCINATDHSKRHDDTI
jgi:hypothetical protein